MEKLKEKLDQKEDQIQQLTQLVLKFKDLITERKDDDALYKRMTDILNSNDEGKQILTPASKYHHFTYYLLVFIINLIILCSILCIRLSFFFFLLAFRSNALLAFVLMIVQPIKSHLLSCQRSVVRALLPPQTPLIPLIRHNRKLASPPDARTMDLLNPMGLP